VGDSTIFDCISSKDPLSDESVGLVVDHAEEDNYVDYKKDFDPTDELHWLEITKDVVAFANTGGGFLVFGVENGTYKIVGLQQTAKDALLDVNMFHQKVNRVIEPDIASLRSRSTEREGKALVVLFIPQSTGITHVFKKHGIYKYPSGKEKTVFVRGTFYVRRSASNHLGDSRDLDAIFENRLERYRGDILDNITRVVNAPSDKKMLLVTPEEAIGDEMRFVIEDAPDSIAVRGMSFSVKPSTPAQEVAGYMALSALPPPEVLWNWYKRRTDMSLTEKQRIYVAKCSILQGAPFFFWIQNCSSEAIRQMVVDLISRYPSVLHLTTAVNLAMFIGKRFHGSIINKLGARLDRIDARSQTIPDAGPQATFNPAMVQTQRQAKSHKGERETGFRKRLTIVLDSIIDSIDERSGQPPIAEQTKAKAIDCYLYARDDKYVALRS